MGMRHSLQQTQTQRLIMTQRLQQALKLLQVPTVELQQILKAELMQNPMLEEVDEVVENEDLEREDSPDEAANEEADDPQEEDDKVDWTEFMQESALDRPYVPDSENNTEFYEKVPVTRTSLAESLLEQLRFTGLHDEDLELGEFLIGSLDDRGWLVTPLDEVAQATGRSIAECEQLLML